MTEIPTRPRVPQSKSAFCPHLGLEEDKQTCLAYPSYWNLCHRSRPASVVSLGHQHKVCLSSGHTSCPVFQSEQMAPLPVELRGRPGLSP